MQVRRAKMCESKLYVTYRVVRNLAPEMKLEREPERRASSGKRQRGMTGRGFRVCMFTNPVEATAPPCILAMPDIAFVSLDFSLCTTKPDLTKFLCHYMPAIKLEPHFMRFQNKNGNLWGASRFGARLWRRRPFTARPTQNWTTEAEMVGFERKPGVWGLGIGVGATSDST